MKPVRVLPFGVVAAFAALLSSSLLIAAPTEIARESFEGAGGAIGFTTSVTQFDEPTVATSDFFIVTPNNGTRLSGGTITGGDGASMFAAEDIDTAPGSVSPTQFITFNAVNITGKTNTSVKLLLAAPGTGPAGGGSQNFYDHSATAADIDFIRVEANVGGGGVFTPILQFSPTNPAPALNSPLSRDTDFDGLGGQGTTLTAAFQEFDIPFSTGATVQIRIVMHSNATSEYICVDNVRIFGESPATSPPVLAGVPGTALIFPEGGSATALAPAITVTDSDSGNLASATVTISSNLTSSEDVLAATPSGAILAGDIVYTAATGTLTITRSAALATYQTVLRSVTYRNSNGTSPNIATRNVTFNASDGTNSSNSPIRQVQVADSITTQNLPFTETFETDGRGTRYALDGRFTGSGSAMFDRGTPAGITNADGSFAIIAEDTLLDAAPIKAVVFQLNTASFGSVNASVRLGALGGAIYDTGDVISIEASVNGGAYTIVAAFRSMGGVNFPLARDTNGDGLGDGTQLSAAMQDFSFAMPAATTLGLRVRCQSNTTAERLIVDRIVVTGIAKPTVSTPVPDVTVNEDAANGTVNLRTYFTDLEDGAAGLTYTVQANSNSGLVSTSINNSTDVLTLDYADNASGTANITIRATDAATFFVEDTFQITVNPVNDKPSFTATAATQANEDAGPQSLPSFTSGFNPGPGNDSGQTVLAYAVSSISAPALFSSPPAVAANGTLTYTPAANANGVATFLLRVQDNGGTADGGIDLSDAQTITITINPVNDKPAFTAAAPPPVNEDAGPQTMSNFILSFTAGPSDESSQTVTGYSVSAVSNPALFASAPTITGTSLFYTPAANANGSSTFEVRATDNGGTANGGVAISDPTTFTITVNSVNDLPTITGQNPITIGEGSSRAIAFTDLLVTDSDNAYPAGFTLTVSNGTGYTRAGNTITPIPGFAGTLSVPVKVNDGTSDSNTLSLAVTVIPTTDHIRNSVRAVRQPNGNCSISFVGVPGETYSIQYSDTLLAGSWHFLASATPGPDANVSHLDVTSPGIPYRYYRILLPYQNDFATGLGAATLRGTAAWEAGALRLTDETGNLVNAVIFDGLPATPDLTGFRARFNLNIGPAENFDPADGVCFAVGNLGAIGWGETGPATASNLSIGFDTYNNGPISGNRGIHVWVNGTHRSVNLTNPFTFGQNVPVEIAYDLTAGLTVKFNGVTIFNNIATTGFAFPANGTFGIGARTGGSVERAVIDDVEILPR